MSPKLSDVECSVVLWSVFAIGSTLTYLLFSWECATLPHIQVHHCTWPQSYTRPSPALVLQVKNTGVRRPGYKARKNHVAKDYLPPCKHNTSYTWQHTIYYDIIDSSVLVLSLLMTSNRLFSTLADKLHKINANNENNFFPLVLATCVRCLLFLQ